MHIVRRPLPADANLPRASGKSDPARSDAVWLLQV